MVFPGFLYLQKPFWLRCMERESLLWKLTKEAQSQISPITTFCVPAPWILTKCKRIGQTMPTMVGLQTISQHLIEPKVGSISMTIYAFGEYWTFCCMSDLQKRVWWLSCLLRHYGLSMLLRSGLSALWIHLKARHSSMRFHPINQKAGNQTIRCSQDSRLLYLTGSACLFKLSTGTCLLHEPASDVFYV